MGHCGTVGWSTRLGHDLGSTADLAYDGLSYSFMDSSVLIINETHSSPGELVRSFNNRESKQADPNYAHRFNV